jgi:hypothetical protein
MVPVIYLDMLYLVPFALNFVDMFCSCYICFELWIGNGRVG